MAEADFRPTASWEMLRTRAAMLQTARDFFATHGFLEVETPLLSHDTVIDQHLDPLAVTLFANPSEPTQGETYWLQTSPEFGMKRLLAAGAPSIFQITRAFRGGERGARHNPEFTMLEWYGVGHTYEQGMQFLSDFAAKLLQRGPAERLSYREAFLRFAGVDPHTASLAELLHNCPAEVSPNLNREMLLDLLLMQIIEPQLGCGCPIILHDYPASQAALAQVRAEDPPVAERFELYVDGVELANGYHELTDPQVLRERNQRNNQARQADHKFPLPEDSRLLSAMQHGLPACAGCALGFDRAVMVATGAKTIDEVLAFPIERA
jgi:elongation factor P--(R)-beta-lysine ligase